MVSREAQKQNTFAVLAEASDEGSGEEEEEASKNLVSRLVTPHTNGTPLNGGWLVDSGSDIHVVPRGMFEGEIKPSSGSFEYEMADGKVVRSEGTQKVSCQVEHDKGRFEMIVTAVVAPVDKPILSVGLLADKGVRTEFGLEGGKLHSRSGAVLPLRRVNNTFVLDCTAAGFPRPGSSP